MMKHLLAAAVLLGGIAPAIAEERTSPPKPAQTLAERCAGQRVVDTPTMVTGPRKLGDEPPASRLYTLYREVDGCPQPVVLSEGVGMNKHKARPIAPARPAVTPTR